MYLTYDNYLDYGGTLDETAFEQLEFEARTLIDYWTFNRLKNETSYPEAITRCMYRLICILFDKQQAMNVSSPTEAMSTRSAHILQQSNDGVSTTYGTMSAKETIDMANADLKYTLRLYLSGVKNSLGQVLLYRGIYPNE